MLFSFSAVTAIFATLAASVSADPSRLPTRTSNCQIALCVAALAPTVIGCVSAAAQEGLDPISDAACLAGTVNVVLNLPASCDSCLEEYGIDEPAAVSSALTSAESKVASWFNKRAHA